MVLARIAALLTFSLLAAVPAVNAQVLAAGGFHNCATSTTGGVVCWGANDDGQLGDGTKIARPTPTNVSGALFGSTALAAGHGTGINAAHSCAVTSAGGVKCWGFNGTGQLGDNSTTERLTPVDVSGLSSGISKITAGDRFSCALSTIGGIQCWGRNNNGQLGDGTAPPNGSAPNQLVPVTVSGFGGAAGATAIAGSYNHVCAVNSAGGAVCWGSNFGSQLGDGSIVDFQNAPVAVIGLGSGVASVAAGSDHSCAVTTGGGAKCWGDNLYGAIGNGTSGSFEPTPVNVSGLASGVAAITAGQFHTCALTTGGAVKCWGSNTQGQLGDGTNTQRNSPVDVIPSGVIAISAGASHTCALFGTGVSSCWGANSSGQIGNGAVGGPTYVPVVTQYPASTTTMLGSDVNPSIYGDNVTFTATVTGGVNGTAVAFRNGGVNIAGCSAQVLAAGTATCTTNVLGGGTRSIAAIYQGTATTLASTSATLSQVINTASQTITFDPLADKIDNDPNFTLAASASSGLTVAFTSLTTMVCTVTGTTVDILIAGVCTIAADQAGNANYGAATQVTQSFTVVSSGPALALTAVQSRKTHAAAGDFDIPITTGVAIGGSVSVESRAIGTGHRIVFQFNIPITATGTAAAIDSMSSPIGSVSAAMSGNDVIVTLTGIPDNRRVTVSLTNVNGLGVNASVSLGFLVGDANGSRSVNITDVNGVKIRAGQAAGPTNFRFDTNASGTINITDVNAIKIRTGLSL